MKRLLPWLAIVAAALVPVAAADDPAGSQRVYRFRQDRPLIAALVREGLRLATEDSPLERAACCTAAAERLAEGMRQAAAQHDPPRIAELGSCLSVLLRDGVAANLSAARLQIVPGSTREKSLLDLRSRAEALLRPLEAQLLHAADAEGREVFERTLSALRDSQAQVERAAASDQQSGASR